MSSVYGNFEARYLWNIAAAKKRSGILGCGSEEEEERYEHGFVCP